MIEQSHDLQSLFSDEDPDDIASKFIKGWDDIIEELAPSKRVQIRKDNNEIISSEAERLKKLHDDTINKAITNKDKNEYQKPSYKTN